MGLASLLTRKHSISTYLSAYLVATYFIAFTISAVVGFGFVKEIVHERKQDKLQVDLSWLANQYPTPNFDRIAVEKIDQDILCLGWKIEGEVPKYFFQRDCRNFIEADSGSKWSIEEIVKVPINPNQHLEVFGSIDYSRDLYRSSLIYLLVMTLAAGGALLLTFLMVHWIKRKVVNPINILSETMTQVSEGQFGKTVEVSGTREIANLSSAFNDMEVKLQETINKLTYMNHAYNTFNVSIPDMSIIIDDQTEVIATFGNRNLSFFGSGRLDQYVGQKLIDLVDHQFAGKLIKAINTALTTQKVFNLEYEIKQEEQILTVEAKVVPLTLLYEGRRAVVWTSRDISSQVEQQKEIRLMAKSFDTFEGIIITDKTSRIVRTNSSFTKYTGYDHSTVVGQTPHEFINAHSSPETLENGLKASESTGVWQGELWFKRQDGSEFPALVTISVARDDKSYITNYIIMFMDISERKKAESIIEYQAYYDALTDLPNRRYLVERLKQSHAAAVRHKHFGGLLFIDLDHFKQVNDSFGHVVGDKMLKEISTRIKNTIREEDTVARLGGDEFVILLEDIDNDLEKATLKARNVADKLIFEVSKAIELDEVHIHTSASIGITMYPIDDSLTVDDLLREADTAMYNSKNEGRNQASFYDGTMQEAAKHQFYTQDIIRNAIKSRQLFIEYQPQYSINGHIVGAEALIRCLDKDGNLVSPGEFIPVAEDSGLILEIGEWLVHQVCKDILYLDYKGVRDKFGHIAINISPRQFNDPDFAENLDRVIRSYNINPTELELEITESSLVSRVNESIEAMNQLKKRGYSFSLDDFGTGYSSLLYLKRFPISKLKIDKSFVQDVTTDPSDAKIVGTIIAMSRHLGMAVIAEGVEDQEQLEFLMSNGCLTYQGYFFSKPIALDRFVELL